MARRNINTKTKQVRSAQSPYAVFRGNPRMDRITFGKSAAEPQPYRVILEDQAKRAGVTPQVILNRCIRAGDVAIRSMKPAQVAALEAAMHTMQVAGTRMPVEMGMKSQQTQRNLPESTVDLCKVYARKQPGKFGIGRAAKRLAIIGMHALKMRMPRGPGRHWTDPQEFYALVS